ncbi:MAG: hypothetical protein H6737_10305 [Alphaproteobacteria bacterium]|nr:hypothetical protein [Alphaproteobacteria bacterium]
MSAERLVLVGAFAMVAGCGSLVGGDYNGEVLYEIEGQVYTDGFDVEGDVGVALVWSNGFRESLGSQPVVVKTAFPARYTIQIFQPPADDTLVPFLGDSRIQAAIGDIILYEDANEDGRWSRDTEAVVGGAFGASLIWVKDVEAELAAQFANGDPVDVPPMAMGWVPTEGFNLVGRDAPFSCVEPWDQWLYPLENRRADLQVSYFFPGVFDWNCDGVWGWDQPGLPPDIPINEECLPDVADVWCNDLAVSLQDPSVDPAFVDEQGWVAGDPYLYDCLLQFCPEVLELLTPAM